MNSTQSYAVDLRNDPSEITVLQEGVILLTPRFLSPDKLLELAEQNQNEFRQSTVARYASRRISKEVDIAVRNTLSLPSEFTNLYLTECIHFLQEYCDLIQNSIGNLAASWETFRASILCYGNGCHFKRHKDTGHSFTERRVLTFVYMFHQEPRKFKGGDLIIYKKDKSELIRIEPKSGLLILFDPELEHEVTPVEMEELGFKERRFTYVGWACKSYSLRESLILALKYLALSYRSTPGLKLLYGLYKKYIRS